MIPFKYTVTTEIHATDAAIAYAGYRNDDRTPITLKIPSSACPSPRQVALLKHEHAILEGLPLPGVLRTIALEAWEQGIALILEPFDGQPLDRLARARPLAPREIVALAIRIAGALGDVHDHGVVHKDIRPQNILVGAAIGAPHATDATGATESIKLTGFGIAARSASEAPHAGPGAAGPKLLEGTPAYMSPEQTGRVERAVDLRADLYSLGVTLYELLTSVLPFRTTDPIELIHSQLARTPTPPNELSPGVPEAVSGIVMKLLAKSPEDRYQTAHGLKADLEECQSRWDAKRGLAPFPLGRRDRDEELHLPRRLHGREPELAALLAAIERAAGGAAELVLVAGDAGAGKSALVNELGRTVVARRSVLFATGRFDQTSRSAPYGAVMQPLRELCRQILTERADTLAGWKQRLLAALGANGQVLADLVPELSFIIGPQQGIIGPQQGIIGPQHGVPELGPAQSQDRLRPVFQDVVRAFAARERPLVLFYDDLQWADAASLELVQALFADPRRAHLLVVGAIRRDGGDDGGADRPPPLDGLASTLELGALALPEVTDLVAEVLSCEPERAAPLAALVREKTGGNPLFVSRFLHALRAQGLLTFDARAGAWAWDPAAIGAAPVTDNVISFMERKLDRLSPAARRAVEIAACAGRELDLATLSCLIERAAPLLQEAQDQGLLVVIDAAKGGPGAARSLQFVHDRVRQAAIASLSEPERQAIHLQLGRLALAEERSRRERSDEALFEAVQHLNLGAPQITAPHERAELAGMNLAAGRRARSQGALPAASSFFEAGLAALPAEGFEHDHELAFALHTEAAGSASLNGQFARAESLLEVLLSRARADLDRARIQGMRVTLYLTQGRLDDALRVGRAALAPFEIDLPEDEPRRKLIADAELAAARAALGKRRIKDLLDAPEMSDERARAALELLMALTMPALLTSRSLATFLAARQVNLSLDKGHSSVSAYGYMAHGAIEARVSRRYEEAYELGTLALDLNARVDDPALSCKLHFLFGAHISLFSKHLLSSLDHLAQAHEAGLRAGDLTYLAQTAVHASLVRIGLGDECEAVRGEVDGALARMQRARDELAFTALTGVRRALDDLMGATRDEGAPGGDAFDEAAYEATLAAPGYDSVALLVYALRQQRCFLDEDYEGALRQGALGEAKIQGGAGHHVATELYFYTCLTLLSPAISRRRQPTTLSLSIYRDRLAEWGERCPDNYRHKHLLVRAESARAAGEELSAMKLYDQAIEAAKGEGFLRNEALANELCAKFHLASGREKIAHLYMSDAYHGYLRWGATAKMDQLAKAYPHLVAQAALGLRRGRAAEEAPPAASVERPEVLDTLAVMRAARTISGEIVLDRLLDRLLRILLGSAGGQRGVLLLARARDGRDGRLTVEAQITVDPDAVRVGPPTPLEAADDLPISVVQYVERTQEPVVLRDAAADPRFARDPYVSAAGARSIMCLAMTYQGRLTGVLYLENNAAAGAFSPAQLELCGLLASQAAIAVQNARLYGQVQETSSELRRGKDALEAEVARRTEQLRDANDRLTLELGSRQRTEQERAVLQEEIIRVQRDRLLELSAPLIPITDRIMVLPLVGEMDPARAAQVLDTTLQGAAASGAEVVIIDVTGAKRVDAAVATALLSAAAALRLLGARVVITGIRADAARTLVDSNFDLSAVVTRGTLQSGLAYALRLTGGDARWLRREQGS